MRPRWFDILLAMACIAVNAWVLYRRNGGFPRFGGKRFDWSVGLFFVCILLGNALVWTRWDSDRDTVNGVYVTALGALFWTAYLCEDKAVLFGWVMWLCEQGPTRSKHMALFYGAIGVFLGFAALGIIPVRHR